MAFPASQWIVLDYMQVIVHIFHAEKRGFYALEDLWGDAPRLAWQAAGAAAAAVEAAVSLHARHRLRRHS